MNDLEIDTAITYADNLLINKPFIITNNSNHDFAFKIKTNQKNLLSMHINHGFLKSHNSLVIPIKIVEKPDSDVTIKLQVNWCVATQEMIKENDSKMTKIGKDQIKKKVFAIERQLNQKDLTKSEMVYAKHFKEQQSYPSQNKFANSVYQKQMYESVYQAKASNANDQSHHNQHVQRLVYNSPQKEEKYDLKDTVKVQQNKNSEENPLQVVSEEDQQDHQKQLETIKNQIISEKRLLDQVKVKVRKIQIERSSKEFIDFRILLLALLGSYLLGSFLKYVF